MAKEYCSPCIKLQEESSEFFENGVTESVCNSLGQNKGFNPESGNTDCEDLKLANDCLIMGNIEELPAYDVCKWKEFMESYLPNQYNMNEAIICALCGLWSFSQNLLLNNLSVDVKYQVLQETSGLSVSVSRNGNWQFNYSDWYVSQKMGSGVIKGKANWCFSVDENKNVSWNIKSVTVNSFTYTPTGVTGTQNPKLTIRVPDENGTIVYQNNNVHGNISVSINKTVDLNLSGSLGTGNNSDWINFCHIYNDNDVADDEINLLVQFKNNNVDSVPTC